MITKIPVPYIVRATSKDHGVDVIVLPGAQQAPEYWDSNRFNLALHQDGSHCDTYCGCMADTAEDQTMLANGETLVIGEWTWQGARSWAVGWRRRGPNTAETQLLKRVAELEGRVEYLEECWADEREGHHLAKVQMNDDSRLIDRLRGELGESAEALEVLRAAREKAAAARDRAEAWVLRLALGGGAAAVVLAVALVWAVIA